MFDLIYYKNDTLVKIAGVKNSLTGAYINNATIQILGVKKYMTSTEINEELFPLLLTYHQGSNGVYSAVLSHNLELEPNAKYTCMIEAITEEDVRGYWEFSFTCRLRQD